MQTQKIIIPKEIVNNVQNILNFRKLKITKIYDVNEFESADVQSPQKTFCVEYESEKSIFETLILKDQEELDQEIVNLKLQRKKNNLKEKTSLKYSVLVAYEISSKIMLIYINN
jgi:hypothetical protein